MNADTLSPEFLDTLLSFTDSFQTSAARFRTRISGDDEFLRVCEVVKTLEVLSRSKYPATTLQELKGETGERVQGEGRTGGKPGQHVNRDAEELLSLMLNAEFVLYDIYGIYEISLHPPLAHWVSFCRNFESYSKKIVESNAEWSLRERVLKMRSALVKGILGKNGPRLANLTPEDFAKRGLDFDVDTREFKKALYEQGNYELCADEYEEAEHEKEQANGRSEHSSRRRTSSYSSASGPGSGEPSPVNSLAVSQEIQAHISQLILKATVEELPSELSTKAIAYLENNPEMLSTHPLDPLNTPTMVALFAKNVLLTRGLVELLVARGSKDQRREVINALQFLPVSVNSLDLVNNLVQSKLLSSEESSRLVYGVLSNGIRSVEAMKGGSAQFVSSADVLATDYDQIAAGGGIIGRQAQAKHVYLLCLFIKSLLRTDAVDPQTLFFPMQEIGVKFMFVPEARELWRTYCAE